MAILLDLGLQTSIQTLVDRLLFQMERLLLAFKMMG